MSNSPLRAAVADRLEVARPHILGAARAAGVPHAVVVHVDGAVAHEVHRADHVVEVARLEQVGHAILAAGDEIRLDAEPQVGLLAHERAVLVEVVVRVGLPEGVTPDLERLREAVHVFGDAQLGDPALLGGGAVALDVRLRVVVGDVRAVAVGPEMEVVVGEHLDGCDSSRIHGDFRRRPSALG